jgi:hypothetical protein
MADIARAFQLRFATHVSILTRDHACDLYLLTEILSRWTDYNNDSTWAYT